ncbi:MAG: phage holin family protein [Rhizobacter sp.]|nr:phage holin family protein [Rhizobacter sp.]
MIHPLLRLAATQPHLIGDHVENYAALVGEEVSKVSTAWLTRIGLYVGALVLFLVGLILVGVALMLRATVPESDYSAGWALLVVPLTPLVLGAVCVVVARAKPVENAFATVKKQINADMAMLREVAS